jgi:dTDP-4-dehydrorhamnose reductase
MKVLVLGASGMLGHRLCRRLRTRFDIVGTIRDADVTRLAAYVPEVRILPKTDAGDLDLLGSVIADEKPDVVVNAVGLVKQSAESSDAIAALRANAVLPIELARQSSRLDFRLITVSTDCVFSGRKGLYTEDDRPDASDLYGMSKLLGEPVGERVLVLRTSIIGPEIDTRHGLLEWFLSNSGSSVPAYRRAVFSGFPTVILADVIGDLIQHHSELSGTYHVSSDPITKYDLLRLIERKYAANIELTPVDEPAIDRSLDSDRFRQETGFRPRPWEEMIAVMHADHVSTLKVGRFRH